MQPPENNNPVAKDKPSRLRVFLRQLAQVLAALAVIVGGLLGIGIWKMMSWTRNDAGFVSSDGGWHDHTFNAKGRHFDAIQMYFNDYKEQHPGVTMYRTTQKPWRADDNAPEWAVPYKAP